MEFMYIYFSTPGSALIKIKFQKKRRPKKKMSFIIKPSDKLISNLRGVKKIYITSL